MLTRELAPVPFDDDACPCVESPGTRVVTEPLPGVEHIGLARGGERADGGKAAHPTRKIAEHRGDLRLLQHHLAHPHCVRIARAAPGEIAPVPIVPSEEPWPEITIHARLVRPPRTRRPPLRVWRRTWTELSGHRPGV
jgi:hypothetical protein